MSPTVKATKIHAIIACQQLTTMTILIAMIWGKNCTKFLKLPFLFTILVEIKNETLKQTLILAIAKNYFNRNGFCPAYSKRHAYSYG